MEILTKPQIVEANRKRILDCKIHMKNIPNWRTKVLQKHPEYDSATGVGRITATYSLRSTHDEKLIKCFEEIVQEYKIQNGIE